MSMGGGGGAPQINFQPTGFNSPGLAGVFAGTGSGSGSGGFGGGMFGLRESPSLETSRLGLQGAFNQQGQALDQLLSTVRPGFSQFRQAGLSDIENQRSATLSNLSDTLSQRRILGSSFANSSISQGNADYDKMRADFIAQSYLQELSASNQLTQEKFQAFEQDFASNMQQLDFESGIAAQMSSSVSQSYAQIAVAQAQLTEQHNEFQQQMQMQMLGMGLSLFGGLMGGGGGGGI